MTDMEERADGHLVELDERSWLPRHARGDDGAFAQLVAAYRAPVYGYLVRCGLDGADRDDLFQEVLIKVHRAAPSYQPSRPLKPWLFTIVANTVRSHFRRPSPPMVVADEAQPVVDRAPGVEATAAARQTLAWLEHAIGELPLMQREVVILCCVEEMGQADVATALQIPVNTVKTHLRRARIALARARAARDTGEVGRDRE